MRIPKWPALAALALLLAPAMAAQNAGWARQSPPASPPSRFAHAMAYDSAHGQVVLFGGENANNGLYNDTWVWDGANWTQKFPQNSPPAREAHAMAYDSVHGQVVLFGGNGEASLLGPGYFSDTWVWDGSNWTQKFPQSSPPARFAHAMAFDSGHGQVVLFAGTSAIQFADTWVWDGTNWTQESPQLSPPGRSFGAMAYDSAHARVVLFGGNNNGALLNDTWLWDGSNWTKPSPQTSPSARESPAMGYDSAHSEAVLFGGGVYAFNGITVIFSDLNDTWVWDGSRWTQHSPQTSPSTRDSHAMAYDAAHDFAVLFGGAAGADPNSVILADTWTWNGGPLPAPSVSGAVSASGFGGFSSVAPGSWVEIYGSGLAPDSRAWIGADFSGNNAPTSLDGVFVTIGGQAAFVDYISPTQVNAQLPSNIATGGALELTVTYANGTSAPVSVAVNPAEPGLLAPPSFQIGGKQYVVALLSDAATYVLPAGAIPGLASRPAKPGETITMYGVGFGPVMPNVPAGQIVPAQNQLSSPLQILFGQAAASLHYQGLAPGLVGLYQFNVVVPPVPDSDLVPLTFTLGGVPGVQTLFTAVHQ